MLASLAGSCGPPGGGEAATPALAPVPAVLPSHAATPPGPFPTPTAERITLKRYGLAFELPDPNGWKAMRGAGRFVELAHLATSSRLLVHLWLETETMSAASCEARARQWRDLPAPGEEPLRQRIEVPRGFTTESEVSLPEPGAASVTGHVAAFGAHGRRCFAFCFVTQAGGPDALARVGDRLSWIEGRTLGGLSLEQAGDPSGVRVPHGP